MGDTATLRQAFAAAWQQRTPAPAGLPHVAVGFARIGAWLPWVVEAEKLLDASERARARRMKRGGDAVARTFAYALHRLFLGEILGIEASLVPLTRDANGRPALPDGWHTSLSHADGAIALAASMHGPVGIDLEREDRAAGAVEIVDEICHPDERDGSRHDPRALLATWVRKEAYLKASGIGLARAMNTFRLDEGATLPLATLEAGKAGATSVVTVTLPFAHDYAAALACPPSLAVHASELVP